MTDVQQPSVGMAAPQFSEAGWQVRPFGQSLGDIEHDALAWPQPVAVTRILAACLENGSRSPTSPTEEELSAWPVSCRLQGLLAITIATRGDRWIMIANCTDPACSAPMDLPLSLGAFRRNANPATMPCTLPDGHCIDVSVPTGADQLTWIDADDAAPNAILNRLVTPPDDGDAIPTDWLEPIEKALEQADPLTTLELETTCPKCGAAISMPLDLEARCLALLAAEQSRLLDDIHALASAYHWSEAEIMAVPPSRRQAYLARIDRMWS